MAINAAFSITENDLEAHLAQATAQKASVDKEITFRSTPELVDFSAALGHVVNNIPLQLVIIRVGGTGP